MGVTYKAFDVNLRCPVALKVIREQYLGDESQIEYAEVSDGSLRMPLQVKCEYIRTLARHVNVLSEVGSKSENAKLTPAEWVEAINSELQAGALSVIAEARESGTVGICRPNCEI